MIDNSILENLTILYAEDDLLIQEGTAETLRLFKSNVICANNGLEALEIFKTSKQNIDMILTDIKMPKLDGIKMIEEIRKTNNTIPIVITTAHQETTFLKKSIELGISSYVLKPIDIYQLRESLIKAIEPYILKNKLIKKNKELKKVIKKNKEQHKIMITQSRFAAMGEMINMISHQWRQPLAAIGTASFHLKYKFQTNDFNLETLEGRKRQADFFNKKFDEIEFYVQNLTTTIDDFRDFYKSDKETTKISIDHPIENALKLIQKSFRVLNIEIVKAYKHTKDVNIYQNEIIHVVLNILKNAQDNFLEKQIQNAKLQINTLDIDNGIKIEISDNGGGIKKSIIKDIFNPYFSTKLEKNGTGIGLYMSKIIVEKHHKGEIKATNTKDGVCFSIILPLGTTP